MRNGTSTNVKTTIRKTWLSAMAQAAAVLALAGVCGPAWAVDGTWTNATLDNEWDTPGNWVGSIAGGIDGTATFTAPAGGPNTVTQNFIAVPRTIGNLTFGNANWDIQGIFGLELSRTTPAQPTITVNGAVEAVLNTPISGAQGFAKEGTGTLALGILGSPHTITGGINLNGGTLRFDDGAVVPAQMITIRNGATLSVPVNVGTTAAPLFIPAGQTANLVTRAGSANGTGTSAGLGGGAGSILNVSTATDGGTISADGSWNTGGAVGRINVTGIADGLPEYFRFRSNGGAYTQASLGATELHLDNVITYVRTGSAGNAIDIGALSGTATAVLSGGGGGSFGNTGTGGVGTYNIGALNTNTTFAGTIDDQSAVPNTGMGAGNDISNRGGLVLNKVGTGTLTLSGTLNYQPVTSKTTNKRGGITIITAGTLKLTGTASLPAGLANASHNDGTVLGDLYTSVDIRSGAFLDVSGATGTYSSSPLQQTHGVGTIVGNYNHDEGILAPGNTRAGTTATMNNVAGTLTFNGNLSFAGSGEVRFDITPSLTTGNDKIMVNGVTTLTGTPTLAMNTIGGVSNGLYTIVESTGGFIGNASGWVVNLGGRGGGAPMQVNGNLLQLSVSTSDFGNVTWSGATDSTWVAWTQATPGPLNWHNNATNVADRYYDFDTVTFADTYGPGPGTPVTNSNVTVGTPISPSAVNVTASTVAYTIGATGAGKITGAATFTKSGAATVTIAIPNDFTGAATINGGAVDIGNSSGAGVSGLGKGALTLNGGTFIAANTAQVGTAVNSSLSIVGSNNRIEINGTVGSSFQLPAWSGSGSVTIGTLVPGKVVDLGANSGFTGAVTIDSVKLRFNGAGSSLANSAVTLTNGAALRDQAQSTQTITLGALSSADTTSTLGGYSGGGTNRGKVWRIGTLNTSTTFSGQIVDRDPPGTPGPAATDVLRTSVAKVGTGTLTLSGTNAYTGFTAVYQGTLTFQAASFSTSSDVLLFNGGTLNLDTSGAFESISELFLNGLAMPAGTYGAVGSGAGPGFELAQITGSGFLAVASTRLQGDFNASGTVDAADLALWQAAFGTAFDGSDADADGDHDSDGDDFLWWQRNLGFGLATPTATGVPEPGSAVLAIAALVGLAGASRRRRAAR